ncbi:MAG: 3-phosphoshikimate 1-carboxyvinyltransferase [Anaerolineae bacterium]|nr:3-phosphoshikimate 1-carboxyvinyltransferase [Thermoflexales bacterium]MDW8406174.1 3-phosphoshikimate 1-carboxyvinyltransferase [Anaerolineae bacterium]
MNQLICPAQSMSGWVRVPGDRSVTVRGVLLGSIADGTSRLMDYLDCDDTRAAIHIMQQLGAGIRNEGHTLIVEGRGLRGLTPASAPLYCDSSGTTMRLLAGLLAGQSFASVLDGSPQLRRRPMRRVTEPLNRMGASISDRDGCAPLHIPGAMLRGISYTLPIASAQIKSALLLAGLYAQGNTAIEEPILTRDHTERIMELMGAHIQRRANLITLDPTPGGLASIDLTVPTDFSSAAFFLVAACIHPQADLRLKQVGLNPTRTGLLDALRAMGARIEVESVDDAGEPIGDIAVRSSALRAITVGGERVARMIDEFPVFAVAATQAQGVTTVRDAEELRVKESNRIDGLVEELRKMGAHIDAAPDGFVVEGPTHLRGAVVDARGDHRMAMALAVAGLIAHGETIITGAECVSKTYPDFFRDLARLAPEAVQ